jgi:hypothetical protein
MARLPLLSCLSLYGTVLKIAVEATKKSVPGVEVLFQ